MDATPVIRVGSPTLHSRFKECRVEGTAFGAELRCADYSLYRAQDHHDVTRLAAGARGCGA
jgi:hypothetical protein